MVEALGAPSLNDQVEHIQKNSTFASADLYTKMSPLDKFPDLVDV